MKVILENSDVGMKNCIALEELTGRLHPIYIAPWEWSNELFLCNTLLMCYIISWYTFY